MCSWTAPSHRLSLRKLCSNLLFTTMLGYMTSLKQVSDQLPGHCKIISIVIIIIVITHPKGLCLPQSTACLMHRRPAHCTYNCQHQQTLGSNATISSFGSVQEAIMQSMKPVCLLCIKEVFRSLQGKQFCWSVILTIP